MYTTFKFVGVHDQCKASPRTNEKPVRVVNLSNPIIVHTDVSQFRDVVQQLTGRDQSRAISSRQSNFDLLLDRLLRQVNRLLQNSDWLPTERCEISFYSHQLSYLSKKFPIFLNTCHEGYIAELLTDPTLDILVTRILKHKNKPLDLTPVGDRLAFEVAVISHETRMQDFAKATKKFASLFQFDRKQFQECEEEAFVGFQAEASSLLQQLAHITKKKLQVISIVGMAGNGKTTLARRLYNDPYVVSHFYVRAWVTCSQVYRKRDIMLGILRSVGELTDEICSMKDNMLAHALYRVLMGRRYLIVVDDIWSNEAWDDLKPSFPNDNNGSRIMLTTRLKDVALHAQPDGNPLCLRFLTQEESFDLFRRKANITEYYFDDLRLIGKSIAKKCHGLPLTVVVIAGLLKNNLDIDWWAHIAESVSSYIVTDENEIMDTLALSYNHLPQHLRPCFLSFGAFPEDHDIPVHKLICLWIAQGFIAQDGTKKSLEDVAEDYLMDLISRSLVVEGKKGTNGAIKTCRVHDLLRDLCLRIAKEENFSPGIYNYNRFFHCLANPFTESQLSLIPNVLAVPSKCPSYSSGFFHPVFTDLSIVMENSELIRVLDLSSLDLFVFPGEILPLVHLRCLAIRFRSGNLPESISHLTKLQTLIVSSKMNIVVPENMWKMKELRHLCIKTGENLVNSCSEERSFLENLQTMSLVSPSRLSPLILSRVRNLRKLGLCGPLTTKSGELNFPDLSLLKHLETLKLLNTNALCKAGRLSDSIIFPETLKSLTVSNTYLHGRMLGSLK